MRLDLAGMNPGSRELDRLGHALRAVLGRAGTSLKEASLHLNYYPQYVGRCLAGGAQLKVPDLFELLQLVGLGAREFFRIYFPLGGPSATRLAALQLDEERPAYRSPTASQTRPAKGSWHRTPAEWSELTRQLLRERIRASGVRMRTISQTLGLWPDSLSQCLRGSSHLPWGHVFGALEAIGVTPGPFFFELVHAEDTLEGALELSEVLDLWEANLKTLVEEGLAARAEAPLSKAPPEAPSTPTRTRPTRKSK